MLACLWWPWSETSWNKIPKQIWGWFPELKNYKDFPLVKDHSMKTSHHYWFQVQLQVFAWKLSSVDFLIYSPKNNGTVSLMIVKRNKYFIEKMNAKSWHYFENVLLTELVTRWSGNSLENDRKIYCFCRKPSFGNMTACDNSNCKVE